MTYPQTGETTGNQALLFIGFALIFSATAWYFWKLVMMERGIKVRNTFVSFFKNE
ncbi:LPXTG cell wall anchor domain-containing protein [Enterococcus durans]|uniref:LPXTG cell wall anchor domain-containing protein n=1 Tax=Enterococcus durans TaxID=53345 RepID=UPI00119138AE|nr:LPXTG cell wall anchor domain-containing protein [Enterococcus durans]